MVVNDNIDHLTMYDNDIRHYSKHIAGLVYADEAIAYLEGTPFT